MCLDIMNPYISILHQLSKACVTDGALAAMQASQEEEHDSQNCFHRRQRCHNDSETRLGSRLFRTWSTEDAGMVRRLWICRHHGVLYRDDAHSGAVGVHGDLC